MKEKKTMDSKIEKTNCMGRKKKLRRKLNKCEGKKK